MGGVKKVTPFLMFDKSSVVYGSLTNPWRHTHFILVTATNKTQLSGVQHLTNMGVDQSEEKMDNDITRAHACNSNTCIYLVFFLTSIHSIAQTYTVAPQGIT